MKNFRRAFAVLLSALLLAAAIPMNAFAATLVKSIDLSVDIQPGANVNDYEDYITINSESVEYASFWEMPVDVLEIYEGEYYGVGNKFDYGCEYELYIYLVAKSGYQAPVSKSQMESVTVNGETVEFEIEEFYDENDNEVVCFVLVYNTKTESTVSSVELTVNPVAGYYIPDYTRYVNIDSAGSYFEETLDAGVIVRSADGDRMKETFVADAEYTLEIYLTPNYGCEFLKDENGDIALETVTVNGEAVEYSSYIESNRGYIEYIKIELKIEAEEKICIDRIDITISEDLAGKSVADYDSYMTINTPGVIFDKYDPFAVWAYDEYFNDAEAFEKGMAYTIVLNFIADEGYYFPYYGVELTINGESYDNTMDYYTPEDVRVDYVFTSYETESQGTFFDRIIAYFRNLFDLISGFFFGWL